MKFKFNDMVIVNAEGFYKGAVGNVVDLTSGLVPPNNYCDRYTVMFPNGISKTFKETELGEYRP